jgi:hypothetical protein
MMPAGWLTGPAQPYFGKVLTLYRNCTFERN